jgi:xanthine dehydrogenase accessory factor
MLDQYLDKLQELKKKNEPFALATVVRREAPSSGKVGDKAVINQWGEIHGWVGGGCVQGIVLKETRSALQSGKPRLVRIGKHLQDAQQHDGVMEYKMTCQSEGTVEVFIEPVLPQPHLVVMGKSEIAKALAKMGKAAGYRVTGVAADANLQTFEKVDELITQLSLANVKTSPTSFIVVATQGMNDEQALLEAMKKHAAYVGFVASRKKIGAIKSYLIDAGCDAAKVEAMHSPAGIDVNAKQPLEVAISILAEIIQVKNSMETFTNLEAAPEAEKPATAPDWYINPVCGVPVDKHNPKHVIEYKEEKVYFCCDGCKVKFEKDPEKYMKAREMGLAPEGM